MLKLYNTLSRKKEIFRPKKGKKANLFVCGPTVYDFSHIGHARTYIAFDIIVKYLKEQGFDVFYLQNITDIDDKIIKRAKEKKINPLKLARAFEKEYIKDMKALKVNSVTKYARATEHIKEILSQVERLLEKGFAYKTDDGVYYDVSKFKGYGKLSGRTLLQAQDAVSRIDESRKKRNKADFCLWKISKPGEPVWKNSFGPGRPGWHIEDTAITEKYFGSQYDIHGGARDLIFPHHEAEIAQMEAISGKKPLVRYWIHTGFLTVSGTKMSKSLGNFITIRDFLEKHSARLLRLFVIKTHYRSPIDYSDRAILQTKKEIERLDEFIDKIQKIKQSEQKTKETDKLAHARKKEQDILILKTQKKFESAMNNDFNTPKAVAVIFDLVRKTNSLLAKNEMSAVGANQILKFFKEADKVFGFIFWKKPKQKIPENILKLAEQREKHRKNNDFVMADKIRKQIEKSGYKIEDTKQGPKLKLQ